MFSWRKEKLQTKGCFVPKLHQPEIKEKIIYLNDLNKCCFLSALDCRTSSQISLMVFIQAWGCKKELLNQRKRSASAPGRQNHFFVVSTEEVKLFSPTDLHNIYRAKLLKCHFTVRTHLQPLPLQQSQEALQRAATWVHDELGQSADEQSGVGPFIAVN